MLLFSLGAIGRCKGSRGRASRGRTKWELTKPKMAPIEAAIKAYILNTSQLPNSLNDLLICPVGLENTWAGPYLKESQLYDPWGNKYRFDYGFRLQSYAADGINGGEGENADIEKFTGFN